ncbi:MAG TPA: TM2 domain-containing protein [Bacilli bacterium]|jgi:hypothetical protein|nr:TM2 domain-containing protein [Bacilli bacterium]HNZ74441.1 TM2 domain-containing protein [Bacilli bacterium]HPV55121.1 TM2 domain-containing protein [Bacilli bacterium]HPX83607.1 TM2 domain-containing protein [Bacilli bacterium]HQB80384.1 TM2 domain-containing protein [Bacilli bacterium]
MGYVKWWDQLPKWAKFLLAFFAGWLVLGVYRILKDHLIAGIIWLVCGGFVIGWAWDWISILMYNKVTLFAD